MRSLDEFTLELVPHCASVSPDGWDGDHLIHPLTELGHQQAETLVAAVGPNVDAIYSSPALRCLQTVQPLATAAGLPVRVVPELLDTGANSNVGPTMLLPDAASGGCRAGGGISQRDQPAARMPDRVATTSPPRDARS